jgi:hypothetical protein
MQIDPPVSPDKFFPWLKKSSEEFWTEVQLNRAIYGFQIQPGTHWRPGLSDDEIDGFERDIGFCFPEIYRMFLSCMNGTNQPTVNLFGDSGQSYVNGPGYYSYPQDIDAMRDLIRWIHESFKLTPALVETRQIPHIVPLVNHRFLIMDRCQTNPVLSMYGSDVIIYASSLPSFLVNDIFDQHAFETVQQDPIVPYWLGE